MKIFIASDHVGYAMKKELIDYLIDSDFDVVDKGAFEFQPQDDYPDFISEVAKEISKESKNSKGIILGGSGQGEAITANRFKNVRAVDLWLDTKFSEDERHVRRIKKIDKIIF